MTDLDDRADRTMTTCFAHQESCVPSRVYGLALEAAAAPVSYHGVLVDGPGLADSKAMFDSMARAALRLDMDHLGYGFAYQATALGLVGSCGIVRPCGADPAERLALPMWAVGYWSPEHVLGGGIDTRVGPAAVEVAGQAWVFFVPPRDAGAVPAGELAVYRDDSILDDAPGTVERLASLGAVSIPTFTDLSSAASGGHISLGVVPDGGGSLVLLSSETGGATWAPPFAVPVAVREGRGTVALAHVGRPGNTLAVVELDGPEAGLALFTSDRPILEPVPLSERATSPALVQLSPVRFELWAREGNLQPGHLNHWVGTIGGIGEVTYELIERVTVTLPVPASDLMPEMGGHVGGGTVAVPFLGRTQLYMQRPAGRISTDAFDALVSGLTGFELRGTWARRPAALNVTDPVRGVPVHVLVSVGSEARGLPQRIVFAQKRSN